MGARARAVAGWITVAVGVLLAGSQLVWPSPGFGWLLIAIGLLMIAIVGGWWLWGVSGLRLTRQGSDALRIRLADPPDDTVEPDLDWAHISVTNDTDQNLAVTLSGYWSQKAVQFEWEPWGVGTTSTIPPRGKGRFAFVVRLRAGGKPFTYGRHQLVPGVCYVCDQVFHRSDAAGETLRIGHHQVRVEAHATGHKTVSRRFDVYVPQDPRKALWVVPRGEHGSD